MALANHKAINKTERPHSIMPNNLFLIEGWTTKREPMSSILLSEFEALSAKHVTYVEPLLSPSNWLKPFKI